MSATKRIHVSFLPDIWAPFDQNGTTETMNVTTCFNLCHYSFNITDANTNPSAIDGTYDDQWDASDFITATSNLAPAEAMELGAKNQVCLNSDLSREPKGIYLLLVNDGQQVTTKKLIKQ